MEASLPARTVGLNPDEILHRPRKEDVIPSTEMQRRNINPAVVLVNAPTTPIIVVRMVLDPIMEKRRVLSLERWVIRQW